MEQCSTLSDTQAPSFPAFLAAQKCSGFSAICMHGRLQARQLATSLMPLWQQAGLQSNSRIIFSEKHTEISPAYIQGGSEGSLTLYFRRLPCISHDRSSATILKDPIQSQHASFPCHLWPSISCHGLMRTGLPANAMI